MNWAAEKPTGCEACTLLNQPGPCYGAGDRTEAKLVYIAQNPGQNEVSEETKTRYGRYTPLVGGSGNVFNRQLTETGIRRDEVYITNQVKCLTPDNREPTPHEINCCRRIIEAELKAAKSDTVVLAGDVAFRSNIGSYSTLSPHYHPEAGLMTRMGCVEQRHGKKWIGTIHPAFIMRMPDFKEAALGHLRKARSIAGVKIPLPTVIKEPSHEDIARHRKAAIDNRFFADDVETPWNVGDEEDFITGDMRIDMCGYSAIRYEAIILRSEQIDVEWREVYSDPGIFKAEHNGVFDDPRLEAICPQLNRKFDTMNGFHYLQSFRAAKKEDKWTGKKDRGGPGFALKPFCLAEFTNLPYYDRSIEALDRKFYCGLDNIATFLAAREQLRQLKEMGLEEVFFKLGMRVPYILDKMRFKGVNVDLRRTLLFRKFMTKRVQQGELIMARLVGPMFNPNSPQQVSALLYDQWKLPKQYNEKRVGRQVVKTLTTDNEARKRLRKYVAGLPEKYQETYKPARIFLDLQDYLEGEKTKLTFLDRISSDGRLHPYFKSHGTSSFRLSSSPNLQNWPVYDVSKWGGARRDTESEGAAVPTGEKLEGEMGSLRSIVIPDDPENDVILTADFGQIEIWMYAVQTGCKWLLDIYHKGEYIYGAFYEQFYKLPFFQSGKPRTKKYKLPDISEKYLRRTKAIPLGWLYGRSDAAIAEEHGISTSDVFVITNGMARACPEIVAQYSRDEFQMNQKGYVRYPFGHLIHFPSRKVTEVKAMRGQNPAGGMLLTSIVLLYDEFVRRKYENTRLMLTVHDSFSFNIPRHKCIEVYEQSIGPILSRPVQELGGFVFPHSCEVSAPKFDPYGKFLEPGRWDWDVEDYKDWKERQGDKA